MKYSFSLNPIVAEDLQATYDYYEKEQHNLGEEFLDATDKVFSRIQKNPLLFPILYGNTRKCNLSRFPFAAYFLLNENEIIITAVIHLMRFEDEWKKRL